MRAPGGSASPALQSSGVQPSWSLCWAGASHGSLSCQTLYPVFLASLRASYITTLGGCSWNLFLFHVVWPLGLSLCNWVEASTILQLQHSVCGWCYGLQLDWLVGGPSRTSSTIAYLSDGWTGETLLQVSPCEQSPSLHRCWLSKASLPNEFILLPSALPHIANRMNQGCTHEHMSL